MSRITELPAHKKENCNVPVSMAIAVAPGEALQVLDSAPSVVPAVFRPEGRRKLHAHAVQSVPEPMPAPR